MSMPGIGFAASVFIGTAADVCAIANVDAAKTPTAMAEIVILFMCNSLVVCACRCRMTGGADDQSGLVFGPENVYESCLRMHAERQGRIQPMPT